MRALAAGGASLALLAGPAAAQVQTAPLAQIDPWGVGWIGANEGAVPSTFWANTSAEALGPLVASLQPRDLSPAGQALLRRILMSRVKGPAGEADLTPERLRLLELLGETAKAVDLRQRYAGADWGKDGERLAAQLELLTGDRTAACSPLKTVPATDAAWLPLRATCAAFDGDAGAVGVATEQIAREDEALGLWLNAALPAIGSADSKGPAIKKPDARFGSPLEAAVSVAARLPTTGASFSNIPADIAASVALNKEATIEQRRAALRPAFYGGKLKAEDSLAILELKEAVEAAKPNAKAPATKAPTTKPDYLALALAAANDKDAKAADRAAAYAAALRSTEGLNDGRLIATGLASAIAALPRNDATLPYAEPIARAALLVGDTKLAADWRKHLAAAPKDKQDAWALARLDLMLTLAGASSEKPAAILDRMVDAAPYPAPDATAKSATSGDQQLAIRRIENTRALFLVAGLGKDLTPKQRAILSAQRTAGRGVSDSAIARISTAARQDADAEAALAILAQLGTDTSAISFAGLSDLLGQMLVIGLDGDATALALEALQVWKGL